MSNSAPTLKFGQVLTPDQWEALFAQKQDWSPILDEIIANGGVGNGGGGGNGGNTSSVVNELTEAAGVVALAIAGNGVFAVTLVANAALHLSTTVAAGNYAAAVLFVTQGGAGSFSLTPPGTAKWQGGFMPSLSTAPGAVDIVQIITIDGGASYLMAVVGQFAP